MINSKDVNIRSWSLLPKYSEFAYYQSSHIAWNALIQYTKTTQPDSDYIKLIKAKHHSNQTFAYASYDRLFHEGNDDRISGIKDIFYLCLNFYEDAKDFAA